MIQRYMELDSLRGGAALAVVVGHLLNITPIKPTFLSYTPLRIFWGGHEAVILFFILSGFVLSLPFYKGTQLPYPLYVVKRIFRIYVPYVVSIILAMTLSKVIAKKDVSGLSEWINGFWNYPTSFGSIFYHAALILDFDTRQLNPVIWSLVQEMRISLLFPMIMLMVIKLNWKTCVSLALALTGVSVLNRITGFDSPIGYFTSYLDTSHYVSMFILGALLAKYIRTIIEKYKRLTSRTKILLLLGGVLLYTSTPFLEHTVSFEANYVLIDWAISGGVLVFIITALGSSRFSRVLHKKVFVVCGELSYSIYLYHLIVLIALTNALYGVVSIYIIYVLTLILTFLAAYVSWAFVEKPAMSLGRRLSKVSSKIVGRKFVSY